MGTISSRDLSPSMRKRLASRAPAIEPDVCSVGAFLPCRVPTVGLHDKTLLHRDRPALRAAKELYAKLLPPTARPVAPPLGLSVQFVLTPPPSMKRFEGVLPYTGKPDLSNLLKVFEDALRRAGYMTDDCQVVHYTGLGKWISEDPGQQGVIFELSTYTEIECWEDLEFMPHWRSNFGRHSLTDAAAKHV